MINVYKQSLGYFRKNKLNVCVLCLLTFLTSFLYFFVESSIDGNIAQLSAKANLTGKQRELLIALNSNKILANTILIFLMMVTCFIFYMFYKKNFETERIFLGTYRSLGFTKNQITLIYMVNTAIISIPCLLAGLLVGYYYTYILLENYQISYHIYSITRGISIFSFFIGIVIPVCLLSLVTYLTSSIYRHAEIAMLFSPHSKKIRITRLEKVARFLPSKYSFSSKLALRNGFSILLIFISVYTYLLLVILSVSLNLSSSEIYKSQTMARTYKYEITFSQNKQGTMIKDFQYFIKQSVSLQVHGNKINNQTLVALDNNGSFFHLVNRGKTIQLEGNGVAIGPRIADVYGLKVGDKITVQAKNFKHTLLIKAVADNGGLNSIYINRSYFNRLAGQTKNTYNGLWSNKLNTITTTGNVETYKHYKQELQNNNVSNRTSAIIDQVLACIFGGLLIFLVLLMNFQDNTNNFIYLRKLGYLHREIKNMLINIYLPLITISFILLIFPSILTCKYISRILSLQTGDYMPFITNLYVFIYALIILVLLYIAVLKIFDIKLRKIFRKSVIGERV